MLKSTIAHCTGHIVVHPTGAAERDTRSITMPGNGRESATLPLVGWSAEDRPEVFRIASRLTSWARLGRVQTLPAG